MKRDMDKVRSVLLALEELDGPFVMTLDFPPFEGTESPQESVEYILMLHSGGFLDQSQKSVYRISWAGHEFLDSVRDPEIWRKTKEGAAKVGSWSIKLLGDLAVGIARAKAEELGLRLS